MSYAITVSDPGIQSPAFMPGRSAKALLAGLVALLLASTLLFSGRASADPVVANQILQAIRQDRQVLDLYIQLAKQHASSGNIAAARSTYLSANMEALKLSARLRNLQQQNLDSLNRGLYRDRAALERAIQFGQSANVDIKVLALDLQMLTQTPTSLQFQTQLQIDTIKFNMNMDRLEQAMRDA
ncbi:hypothetical protein [Lysobacter sp. CA199]|uniref:hypothetical protein n=1 Tax=Lysobacter sp. CA199 TaxID=3455608 RepID=UPI003F8D8EA1